MSGHRSSSLSGSYHTSWHISLCLVVPASPLPLCLTRRIPTSLTPRGTKVKLTVTIEHLGGSLCNIRGDVSIHGIFLPPLRSQQTDVTQLTDWETGKRFASGRHVKTWRDLRSKL